MKLRDVIDGVKNHKAELIAGGVALAKHLGLGDSAEARWMRNNVEGEFVDPPPPGTPLLVPLGVLGQEVVEHTGIYLGDGHVAELRGDGKLLAVSLEGFLRGSLDDGSVNPRVGSVVFAACDKETHRPVYSESSVANAQNFIMQVGEVKYDYKSNNCHMFTNACVTGELMEMRLGIKLLIGGVYTIRRLTNDLARQLNGGSAVSWYPVRSQAVFTYLPQNEVSDDLPKE